MKKWLTVPIIIGVVLLFSGCNAQQTALKAQAVIADVLTVAKAEAPNVPAADQAAYINWVNLGISLDGQLASCITSVSGITGKGAKFQACFNTFATGFVNPTELAQLRLLSPGTVAKVQLYADAIIVGVDLIVTFTTPQIAPTPTSSQDLHNLGIRAGLSPADLRYVGL